MKIGPALSRWWVALPCVALLAVAILVPGLGTFGLWEPHERQLSDRATRPAAKVTAPVAPEPPNDGCLRQAPPDAVARTLTTRAPAWGRDAFGDSDRGRRLPFALLGILCVLASAGIAMRLVGARAGVITAVILLSMPFLVLQARQLTSEIATAAAGALTIYGLLAIGSLERVFGAVLPISLVDHRPHGRLVTAAVDGAVGVVALATGIAIGFWAGGALLGVMVPTGAFAAAGGFGATTIGDALRWLRNRWLSLARWVAPRWASGRELSTYRRSPGNAAALLATALAGIALAAVVYQVFSLREPRPDLLPARALFGKVIVSAGCYSPALGGVWRADDDLRSTFDSSFEQIAYGTFPWGVLAPIAFAFLLAGDDRSTRRLGALALAWAAVSWIATELFQRKVGFTLWAGFPAVAIAIGGWLDGVALRNAGFASASSPPDSATPQRHDRSPRPTAGVLIGIFAIVAIAVIAKDLQTFTVRLASFLVGNDAVAYPASYIGPVPTRLWVLVLGTYVALGFAAATIGWSDQPLPRAATLTSARRSIGVGILGAIALPFGILIAVLFPAGGMGAVRREIARLGLIVASVGTVAIAAFWSFGWQPALATHLSSKAMFDRFGELAKPGDALVILGDMGDAPRAYAPDFAPEMATTRQAIVAALSQPTRAFAIAPQSELCQLHRELADKPYFVIDDRNVRSLLLSNRVEGTTDRNPLRTAILHSEPTQISTRPTARIVWDNRIELLGWNMPAAVKRGSKFTVTMVYKVLQPVGGAWKVLFHFDGPLRFNGDHEPIGGRCQTSTWQPGDYIVDRHTVVAGGGAFAPGSYDVWTGFFAGSTPNFRNMPVTDAPAGRRDNTDRIKIATIALQ